MAVVPVMMAAPTEPKTTGDDSDGKSDSDGALSDAGKAAFCAQKPEDAHRTGGDGGSDKSGMSEADKIAYCDANPGDVRCAGGDSGSDAGSKDDSGTKDDRGGQTKNDGGSKPGGK